MYIFVNNLFGLRFSFMENQYQYLQKMFVINKDEDKCY